MFGRDISQTMVLTPSRLVADSFDDLFGMIQKRGYKFVTMEEAQADEAYQDRGELCRQIGHIVVRALDDCQQGKPLRDEPKVERRNPENLGQERPKPNK